MERRARRGDYAALNQLEYEAARQRIRLDPESVLMALGHDPRCRSNWPGEPFQIVFWVLNGVGRLASLVWRTQAICPTYLGEGHVSRESGVDREWVVCPGCERRKVGSDKAIEVVTDMAGRIEGFSSLIAPRISIFPHYL